MPTANRSLVLLGGYAAVFAAAAIVLWLGIIPGLDRNIALYPALFAVVMLLVLVGSALWARRHVEARTSLLEDAAARRFRYTPELRGLGLPGILFSAGEKTIATDVVDALASATPFLAGGLVGQYASDTSAPRSIASSFMAIPLQRTVPHIVLLGTGIGMMKLAGIGLAATQKLTLEGDFTTRFTLYCPAGYERDALQIFTPDLMQLMMDTTNGCDVELVDNWMFVYSRPGRYLSSEALDGLVRVTERVQAKVNRQTSGYRDERAAGSAASAATSAPKTISPAEHAERVGRVAATGSRIATASTPFQKVVTVLSTLLLVGAVVAVLIDQLAR